MRWELKADPRVSELAILVTARALDCPYVWNAHAPLAVKAGVSRAFVDALRDDKPLPAAPDDETTIVRYGLELMRGRHAVSDETFMKAHALFGTQLLVELTSLMGHYAQNAFVLNAFEVDLPVPTSGPVLPV
jgi:4-carboxymuconolactone decarboxylase